MSKHPIRKNKAATKQRSKKSYVKDNHTKSKKKQNVDSIELSECFYCEYSIDILASQYFYDKFLKS